MAGGPLYRVRRMALALREVHEIVAWGAPVFRIREKMFVIFAPAETLGYRYNSVWCRMPYDEMAQMVEDEPDRFFEAPFIGALGWLGIYLDAKTDWKELKCLVSESYRSVAPSGLTNSLDLPTMPPRPLFRVRRIALALPEAHEVEAWGEPTFRVRNKLFAMFASAGNHHGGGRNSVWCKAKKENQEWMVRSAPDRYFVPPYVGPSGWVGVYLDGKTDWDELTRLLSDGYRSIAPKRLLAALEAPAEAVAAPKRPTRARGESTKAKAPAKRSSGRTPRK